MRARLTSVGSQGFALDRDTSTLLAEGRACVLSARAFAILWRLAAADGERVDRETLFRVAWPGQKVAAGSLRQAIWEIRQALGQELSAQLESVRGAGYRLACERVGCATQTGALVGRVRERSLLGEALDAAVRGCGRARLLSGPAGIGKSALAGAVLQQAAQRGVCVLAPGGARGPGAPALWPFILSLSELPAQAVAREQHVQRLLRVLTDPQPDTGWAERAAEQRFLLFEELARVLVRMADKQPIALFLDDLHEVDATSLAFVARLAHEVGRHRIFLLLATRPLPRLDNRELTRTREQLRALDAAVEIPVGDLGLAELRELLAAELG
jgi:DNA-binding winged helix-turn-helix (wHTH) protein